MATVASDWMLALDPVRFAAAAGYVLDPWQADVLDAYPKPKRLLLNCSRQAGKTLVTGILCVRQALYEEGSLAVVAAVGQFQAMETIRVCRTLYAALGRPVPAGSENKLSLEMHNKSRILSIPSTEATVRGLSKVGLLVLDEASRIPDAFYGAVLPFLAVSDGALALLSTPFGKRGFFYDSYRQQKEWLYQEVPAEQCPRISRAFLAEQRKKMSELLYAQEYECQFNDSVRGAFRSADIDAAVKDYPTWNLRQYTTLDAADVESEEDEEADARWNLSQYQAR